MQDDVMGKFYVYPTVTLEMACVCGRNRFRWSQAHDGLICFRCRTWLPLPELLAHQMCDELKLGEWVPLGEM